MFKEIQHIRRSLMGAVIGLPILINAALLSNNPSPGQWFIFITFSLASVVAVFSIKLSTELQPNEIQLKYPPFLYEDIPYKNIVSAERITYRPWDHSGWNFRRKSKAKPYIAAGNEGVQLSLKSGETVLIGSQRPAELLASIEQRLEQT